MFGILLVGLISGSPGSPFQPPLPPGDASPLPFRWLAGVFGISSLSPHGRVELAILAVILATGAFLFALREAWNGTIRLSLVIGLGIAFHALAAALPPLFSHDVYSYSIYGRIGGIYHANPYVATPGEFPSDPFHHLVSSMWQRTPTVYGPVFTVLSEGLARLVHSPVALVRSFKIISAVASVGTMLIVARVALHLRPQRAAFAAALIGLNPVVLFNSVGGGHNDSLVALSLVSALWLITAPQGTGDPVRRRRRRELLATAALTLGALIKAVAFLPLALFVGSRPLRARAGERSTSMLGHLGIVVGAAAIMSAPFWLPSNPTLGLATLVTHRSPLAPIVFVQSLVHRLATAVGGASMASVAGIVVRIAFPSIVLVALVVATVRLTRRNERARPEAHGAAWAWILLLFILTSPAMYPSYVVWALPLAWLLPRVARLGTLVVLAVLALSQATYRTWLPPTVVTVGHAILPQVAAAVLLCLLLRLVVDFMARNGDVGRVLWEEPLLGTAGGLDHSTRVLEDSDSVAF